MITSAFHLLMLPLTAPRPMRIELETMNESAPRSREEQSSGAVRRGRTSQNHLK